MKTGNRTNDAEYGSEWPVGAVIEMYGEQYRIRRNLGNSGHVEYLDGVSASNNFYWQFQGDKATLVSLPQSE